MKKFIRIHATCPFFEILELVAEKESFNRLEVIKKMYIKEAKRRGMGITKGKGQGTFFAVAPHCKLSVTTSIANPTIQGL